MANIDNTRKKPLILSLKPPMVFFLWKFSRTDACINISKTVKDKISYIDPNKKENQFQMDSIATAVTIPRLFRRHLHNASRNRKRTMPKRDKRK
jgi:hypothetical protein